MTEWPYVAVSRARVEATIYTDSADSIAAALDRQVDKQMALEFVHHDLAARFESPATDRAFLNTFVSNDHSW